MITGEKKQKYYHQYGSMRSFRLKRRTLFTFNNVVIMLVLVYDVMNIKIIKGDISGWLWHLVLINGKYLS